MKFAAVIPLAGMLLAHHASAQNGVMINNGNRSPAASEKPQMVNVTVQLTLPAPDISSSADMTKAMAAANQSLYDIINHECDVLTTALKGSCRLGRLTVGSNFNDPGFNLPVLGNRPNVAPVVSANANATFEIGTKTPAATEPPATPVTPSR